jgi:group I intron endonuclease
MKICGIYKITSPSNKVYIGQSIDIIKRFKFYCGLHCRQQQLIYNSLKKHGVDKHKFEVLCQCSREELNNLEVYYIDLYQSFNSKFGLNLKEGGGNYDVTKQSKKRTHYNLGVKHYFFGKKHKPETILKLKKAQGNRSAETRKKIGDKHRGKVISIDMREKLSKVNSGKGNPMYGKTHSPEIRKMLSDINKNPSLEKRKMLSEKHNKEKKPVYKLNKKTGEIISDYESIEFASKETGIDASQIGHCCKGRRGYYSAGGFKWKFKLNNN